MVRSSVLVAAALLWVGGPPDGVPVTLAGSPESMARQNRVAVESGLSFLRTPRDVRRALAAGELVRLRGGRDFAVKSPGEGAARPEMAHFLERFAADFRAGCGERLVVTSLTRPRTRQPSNAHPLSVHPAGMAVDLRVPRRPACRRWLERSLLRLERQGVLDATREHSPPHFHVALFPGAYLAHLGLDQPVAARVVPPPPLPPAPAVTAPPAAP